MRPGFSAESSNQIPQVLFSDNSAVEEKIIINIIEMTEAA